MYPKFIFSTVFAVLATPTLSTAASVPFTQQESAESEASVAAATATSTSPSTPASEPEGPATQTAEPPSTLDRVVASVLPGLKLSGTIWLYDYQPFGLPGTRASFDLYGAHLTLDRDGERVGFHIEYRIRTTKLRSFFTGPTWLQEGYLRVKAPGGNLKVGQMYKQFGIFTDYAFYGGLPYFDGLKYNPEWGVSYEGNNVLSERVSLDHAIQYFRTDSRINGSLPGRDVVSDPTGRRRNEVVARFVPGIEVNDTVSISFGPSFERGEVSRAGVDVNDYWRVGGEATLDIGATTLFGEVIRQDFDGPEFPDLPKVTYGTVGLDAPLTGWLSTHVNYGQGNYSTIGRRKEYMIQPGLVFSLGDGYAIYLEYQYWVQEAGADSKSIFDRSLNTALYISF